MSLHRNRSAGSLRDVLTRRAGAAVEALESRRLLAAASFGAPISTALPGGFVPVTLIPTGGNGSDVFVGGYLVTGASGGGLLMHGNNDGTFSPVQTLSTSATILGAVEVSANGNTPVPTIITTSGSMTRQGNGTFSAPSGFTLPSDAVAGSSIWDPDHSSVVFERFHPNTGDPTKGSLILADFQIQQNGTFGSETDTTIATNVSSPPTNRPLWLVNLFGFGGASVVAGGLLCAENSDGTFNVGAPVNLNASELASPGYPAPLLTSGFGNPSSVVIFPAPPAAGDQNDDVAEVAINTSPTGSGGFGRGGRVSLAAKGTTAGPIVLRDFTKDGTADIAVAVASGTGSPAVSLAAGVGDGTFFTPVLIPVSSLTAVAGVNPANGAMLCFTATGPAGGPLAYSLATLPNNSVAGPVIQLTATPTTAFVNQPVILKAITSSSNSTPRGSTMDFFDGSTRIGQGAIGQDGAVTFVVSNLAAGVHTITAQDETYGAGAASPPITVTLNADPPHPLVSAQSFDAKLPTVITPGDKGLLTVNLSNVGASAGTAKLAIKLFATPNGVVDSSAIPVPIPSIAATSQNFGARRGKSLKVPFNVPDAFAPGSYQLVLTLDAAPGSSAADVIPATIVHDTPVTAKWQFGIVGDRKNVKFVQHLAGGRTVTFSLTGAGTGTITRGGGDLTLGAGSADYQVVVDGTNIASKLAITQSGSGASNIVSLTLNNNIGSVDVTQDTPLLIGPGAAPVGGVQPTVSVGKLYIGTMPAGQLAAGADPATSTAANININGSVGQFSATTIANGTVQIGTVGNGGQIASAKVGTLAATGTLKSQYSFALMQLGTAQLGSGIQAPSIGSLKTSGDFNANLDLTQPPAGGDVLGSAQIGGAIAATSPGGVRWAVNGNIGKVQINGAVKNFVLLGGAKLGTAGELTTPPAAYSGTSIFSISIRGAVTSSLFAAGLDPVDGVLQNSNDKLLPGGSFGSISVLGSVSPDSRFEAASLPAFAVIGGTKVVTSGGVFKSA